MLEDLIVGAWLVYGLSHNQPDSELHSLAAGIINTFELHKFGWSRSWLIPRRFVLEGRDETLDERIDKYCKKVWEHEQELRKSLVMMIVAVRIEASSDTNDLMYQWAENAMKRHHISFDTTNIKDNSPNFVPPTNKTVQ